MKKVLTMLLLLTAFLARGYADTWTVAGHDALTGHNWDVTATENDMTAVAGTTLWTLTKTVTISAGAYEFKVAKDHAWDTSYPDQNQSLTIEADGTYDITFWYNTSDNSVYGTYAFSVIGNLWDNWATDKDMTQSATNENIFTLVVENFEATVQTYEYKVRANHNWVNDYENPAQGNPNKSWECTEAGTYTLTFTLNMADNSLTLDAVKQVAPATGYTVDFNTAITTSNHDFKVAKGWGHIVPNSDYDGYGPYYMSYSYYASMGVDGSGCLMASRQYAGDYSGGEVVKDILVTPIVNGTITLDVKAYSNVSNSNPAYVEVYSINTDGTLGNLLKTIKEDIAGYNSGSNTAWATFTLAELTTEQKLGLRLQYVYVDNFTASSVNIPLERTLEVTKVANLEGNTGTGGTTTYFEQQADGTLKVQLQVTLTNTGDYDFVVGDTDYTLTLASATTASGSKTYYDNATVTITEALAVGETKAIDVDFFVPYPNNPWNYWFVKENVSGTTSSTSRYAGVTAYEPKFVFRAAGSTSTSNLSGTQAYGLISAETTNHYEIANTGTAPLIIKSISLPAGFTSDNLPVIPTEGLSVAKGATQALDITLPITTMGSFAGNLTIVYLDKNNTEQTYTLAFSGNVLPAGTWSADFNGGNAVAYPAGSIAEGGINSDYTYSDGANNYYILGRSNSTYATENNKFITPKLHATAGQQLTFDVKGVSGGSYYAKVYVSTDRKTWGEPVAYFTYGEKDGAVAIGGSWVNKSITFDTEGDYYVAFSLYGTFAIDNIIGLTKVDVAHDLYIKSVNWPDASVKSGTSLSKPSLDVIPLTDEAETAYTVKYVCGATVLATGTPVALTASANSSKTFSFSWTPSVVNTTVYSGTKVVFEFTDGTKIESEPFDLTVTNEPKFHFVKTLPSSKWYEPNDYTTPITFGKTNTADSQSFYVYNWGSAPLTVKSIAVPAGFTATPASQFTVAAFDENDMNVAAQAVEITFSATEAGVYSGDMVITYVNGAGEDATFTLAVSGTKLDPTKWYANFGGVSNQWPAGSVYQSNVSTTYIDTNNYGITSSSATNNIFVTPKLTAATGDKLMFDAKLYNSTWGEGKVVVYAAASREEVLNAEDGTTRVQVFSVSGEDVTNPMTTDFQTFEVPALAGDYYYGFEISNRPYVDELYGLTVTEVAHDLQIVSYSIPTDGMQNSSYTASVNVLNLGLNNDAVTVTAYVNGEIVATSESAEVPMSHILTDGGTLVSPSLIYPKTGEYPLYLEVKAGDFTIATAPVNVTFAEEVAKTDVATGESGGPDSSIPLNMYYKKSETIALYTPAILGLNEGQKIKSITWKGYCTKTFTSSLKVYYEWTDDTSISTPASGAYDVTGMNEALNESSHAWAQVGSANELGDMIVVNFATPIEYEAGKSLRILVSSSASNDAGYNTFFFEKTTTTGLAFGHQSDSNLSGWNAKNLPMIYLGLEASSATLSGTVKTSDRSAIEGATVTLKADNGVQYSGTTAADGTYSINVIQAGLDFTATVEATGYLKRQFALNMNGASATSDVTMYTQFGLVGTLPGLDENTDVVMTATEDPNIFTLEMNNVAVTAGNGYTYKLRADGAWDYELAGEGYELPQSGDFTWNFSTSGTYNYKFTFDWTNHTLTFERPFTLSETADGIADLNWVDVTVEREFKAGWNAVVLPFGLDDTEFVAAFGANSEVAVYNGDSNNNGDVTVNFKKQDATYKWIEAGVPYLIWLEQPVSGLKFTKDISSTLTTVEGTTFDFVGTYTSIIAAAGDYFIAGGKFVKATSNNTIKPFRSYLKLKDGQTARSINFVVGDDVATDIDGLTVEHDYSNDTIYNLSGQKVQQPTKRGIYIINGKKVMVK